VGYFASPRSASFAGPEAFGTFQESTEILVNQLALTQATRHPVPYDVRPPAGRPGADHPARGFHLVEPDLLAALASGRLATAAIDAFPVEKLPPEHPFWRHPRRFVTPHCSITERPQTIVGGFAENVRRLRAGEALLNKVDCARGYRAASPRGLTPDADSLRVAGSARRWRRWWWPWRQSRPSAAWAFMFR
jgi:glyoxylate/hydroxypyruvate reductase A